VNCFGGRSNTVQKAIEALLLFIEVDRSGEAVIVRCCCTSDSLTRVVLLRARVLVSLARAVADLVPVRTRQMALLPECFSKQWKVSSTTISTIALALKTFGSKHVPLKPILKEVAKMFEDSNAKVREEAQKLVIEMYRWAGAALKPTVDTLRPAQAKDLNTAFEALPKDRAVPEKRLRCEQPQDDEEEAPAGRAGGGGGGGGEEDEEEGGGMDAYELAEPVDVLSKLPGDWYDKVVRPQIPRAVLPQHSAHHRLAWLVVLVILQASTKWKERNEQMDALLALLNTPRLQPGDYRELTKTIKKVPTVLSV
jgi:cytoskeleton-associated protein 5